MSLHHHCARILSSVLLVFIITAACDKTASLLDFEALQRYLDLTPSQAEVISGYAQQVIAEVEAYILIVRQADISQSRNGVDGRTVVTLPHVETARQQAVEHIRQIAAKIRGNLTAEQQEKFDRIILPDLRESLQELEFLMAQSRRGTFSALRVKPVAHVKSPASGASYDDLKEERTIVFGPGGFSSGLDRFPLFITATLFDSVLVEAELRHTAPPDSASGDTGRTYFAAEHANDMFTIRLILSTFLHESYTSIDRWVVFIEDDKENQYEPIDIIEDRSLAPPKPSSLIPRGYRAEGDIAMGRKARQVEIRFPYRDDFGRQILGPDTQFLRLILFDKKNAAYRTQGEWVLQ